MNYETLFEPFRGRRVRAGLIGVGAFGASLVAQSRRIEALEIPVLCDAQPQRAVAVLQNNGHAASDIALCETDGEARAALEAGKAVVLSDGPQVAALPLDIVVEATGHSEAAVRNALAAIDAGKDLAMVSKEADSVVGPALQARANDRGCVYTLVEGDQPSLLIGLVSWARTLGLEIVAAGKSSEYDFVYDRAAGTVTWTDRTIDAAGVANLWQVDPTGLPAALARRADLFAALPSRTVSDLCEVQLVANATGMRPDRPDLLVPHLRICELPDALRPAAEGGLLGSPGVLEVFNCLREAHEPSFAGGVFVVVACQDRETWSMLGEKGHPRSADGRHALLYNPQHLLGVEAPLSLLSAVLLRQPTGARQARQLYDLAARAAVDLPAGTVLEITDPHKHEVASLSPFLVEARPLGTERPLPYYMAVGQRLARDLPAGAVLTLETIEAPADSLLWSERRRQDARFFDSGEATAARGAHA